MRVPTKKILLALCPSLLPAFQNAGTGYTVQCCPEYGVVDGVSVARPKPLGSAIMSVAADFESGAISQVQEASADRVSSSGTAQIYTLLVR